MESSTEMGKTNQTSFGTSALARVRSALGGRQGWIVLGVSAAGVGAALNWGWLTAIGVAPILLALAPCALMCGLGIFCVKNMGGKSCSPTGQPAKTEEAKSASNPLGE